MSTRKGEGRGGNRKVQNKVHEVPQFVFSWDYSLEILHRESPIGKVSWPINYQAGRGKWIRRWIWRWSTFTSIRQKKMMALSVPAITLLNVSCIINEQWPVYKQCVNLCVTGCILHAFLPHEEREERPNSDELNAKTRLHSHIQTPKPWGSVGLQFTMGHCMFGLSVFPSVACISRSLLKHL